MHREPLVNEVARWQGSFRPHNRW